MRKDLTDHLTEAQKQTTRSYETYVRKYIEWTADKGIDHEKPNDVALGTFLKEMAEEAKVKQGTAEHAYFAVMHSWRFAPGGVEGTKESALLKGALEYTRKTLPSGGDRKMTPFTGADVRRMLEAKPHKERSAFVTARDNAMLALAFVGGYRENELARLKAEHVKQDPHGLTVTLVRAKNNQTGPPQPTWYPALPLPFCPTKLMQQFSSLRTQGEEYFFHRAPSKSEKDKGKPLADDHVYHVVKGRMKEAGLDPTNYGSHSLRRGMATSMHAAGYNGESIRAAGRWRSDAWRAYVEPSLIEKTHHLATLVAHLHPDTPTTPNTNPAPPPAAGAAAAPL
jgi:site-specific recombinase XerD